ncbi:universal stress protein [Marinobacter changyiensis]|uniref:universal stress protein n=1 Tax=Marinobacter changyiensis TaxID=2604091 RepID=UPI001263FF1A|nr:universal stress protein [Marinobacter changyiensis]
MNEIPKLLLVPVDGSNGAGAAAQLAASFARKLNIPLRLLFVFPATPMDMFGVPSEVMNPKEMKYFAAGEFEKLRDKAAARTFEAARKSIGDNDIAIEDKVLAGQPAEAIVDHAKSEPGAMIVIGRRGLSSVKEIFVGSVSQRVIHKAQCPVLLAR